MPVTTLVGIVNDMFDHISTSLTLTEIIDLAKDVAAYNLVDTTGFPFNSTPMTLPTGGELCGSGKSGKQRSPASSVDVWKRQL